MKINKKNDMTPFLMSQKPSKQYFFLMPLIWLGSYILTRKFNLKIEKENMKGLKPPYIVIATHQGFSDYYIGPLAVFPRRAMYVSDMEGFANFGKWLYRGLGCIGKRRYVSDISVVQNIKYALKRKQIVFIYPESRHSNVGTTAYIPDNIGKLVKMMNVPLVILKASGSYLANPFWDEEYTRVVPMHATMKCVYNRNDLNNVTAEQIQKTIELSLSYDEYEYQRKYNIVVSNKQRISGLHKVLFRCHSCNEKYYMKSDAITLKCDKCKSTWSFCDNGDLTGNIHIPDWYEWEKRKAIDEINEFLCRNDSTGNNYIKSFNVRIYALPNEKGFVKLGDGRLSLNSKEFVLEYDNNIIIFSHSVRESVQTEYNYSGNGMCVVMSTKDCCYYLYSDDLDFNATELQFYGEYLFKITHNSRKIN